MKGETLARPKALRLQPTKVKTTSIDSHGMLVYENDLLVAVLVQMEPSVHGDWNPACTAIAMRENGI